MTSREPACRRSTYRTVLVLLLMLSLSDFAVKNEGEQCECAVSCRHGHVQDPVRLHIAGLDEHAHLAKGPALGGPPDRQIHSMGRKAGVCCWNLKEAPVQYAPNEPIEFFSSE